MLPASTAGARPGTVRARQSRGEISRLIGRSLRQAIDLNRWVSAPSPLTAMCWRRRRHANSGHHGGFVALCLAIDKLIQQGHLKESPIKSQVAAVSCGLVDGTVLLDLCYVEDSQAQADMNFVMNEELGLIEVQGTGEGAAFPVSTLSELLELAQTGIRELMSVQKKRWVSAPLDPKSKPWFWPAPTRTRSRNCATCWVSAIT